MLLQYQISPLQAYYNPLSSSDALFFILICVLGLVGTWVALLLVRMFVQENNKEQKAFNRVVLQISVPKERKSEGQGGSTGQDDRLEQIREEIGITETLFATITGLKAQKGLRSWFFGRDDTYTFEIVVRNHLIYFYVEVQKKWQPFIEQQIQAQYPYAEIQEIIDYNLFTPDSVIMGGYLQGQKSSFFPFKTFRQMDSDPLAATLNTLAKIYEHDSSAAIQFVLRSAPRRWRSHGVHLVREVKKGKKFEQVSEHSPILKILSGVSTFVQDVLFIDKTKKSLGTGEKKEEYHLSQMEEDMLKGIEQKMAKGGAEVTIRVLSVSKEKEIAQMNLDNILNTFTQYNMYRYGNSFKAIVPRNQKKLIREFIYRSLHERYHIILNTEELASLWHLPLHSTETPNIHWLHGRQAPPPTNLPTSGLLLGFVDYRGQKQDAFIKEADRRRHLYIIGKSGSGKSVTIANLAIQDILDGKGVCVVDPHGDLVEAILEHVPKERADDVIIFDPSDLERPIGLNMLEVKNDDQKDFAVQEMIGIFYKLFPPEMIGPMFEHNMRNVMLTLMADINDSGTVIDIPRMFTDDEYVKQYLKKLTDPVVRAFWEKEMAKTSDFHKSEMLGYLISKVGRFVGNEMMRNIMGQQRSGFNFREVMDNQKILLVNLAKGRTGEVNAKLLGLIIVAKLQMAAMARADMPEEDRKDFYLYIDEFQNFITDSISTILSEARKYKLDLIIAHQYMGQLTDDKGRSDIRDAVLGNVGTMMVGRIGPDDSEILAKEFAPVFGAHDLLNTPKFAFYAKILIDNQASKPFLLQAHPPRKGNPELAAALKELSRLKYGRDRRIVEAEIMERTKLGGGEGAAKTDMIEASL